MGFFDTKSSSSNADGSNQANTQASQGSAALLPTITAGDDIKNMNLSMSVEEHHIDNSIDYSQEVYSETDNSVYMEDNSDHSQYFEDNSDHSQYFEDNSDHSQYFEDNTDNSVVIDGEYAGNQGSISIVDGGAIAAMQGVASKGIDASMVAYDTAVSMSMTNSDLARDMVEITQGTQVDTTNALTNGFQSMMQFAESYSRSDGAAIAKDSNNIIKLLIGGLVVAAFMYRKG